MPFILWFFCGCHFVIWILLPYFLRRGIPMDALETLVWGTSFEFGTNKHPFLSAWIADIFFQILPDPALALYVLSQVCVVVAFIFIYRLACAFVDPQRAVLSVVFLEGILYYSLFSVEYNVNVLSLAFVAIGTYIFYLSVSFKKIQYWILTGVLAGCLLMIKYTNFFALIGWGVYLVVTCNGRSSLKTIGPWIAGSICAIICLPHLFWLIRYNFYPFDYLFLRASSDTGGFIKNHLIEPFRFLGAQILVSMLSLLAILLLFFEKKNTVIPKIKNISPFLWCVGVVPIIAFAGFGIIFGNSFKSMWGYAFLGYLPLILIVAFIQKLTLKQVRHGFRNAFIIMGVLSISFILSVTFHVSKKASFDGQKFAKNMYQIWEHKTGTSLSFVGGDIWYASNIALLGEKRLPVLIDMNTRIAPWIDLNEIYKKGILVVAPTQEVFKSYQKIWPKLSNPVKYHVVFKSLSGRKKTGFVYFGFLEPIQKGG